MFFQEKYNEKCPRDYNPGHFYKIISDTVIQPQQNHLRGRLPQHE